MGKGFKINLSPRRYPGDGFYYAICDCCGFKFRANELRLMEDKYNLQNGLLLCKKDYDQTNPQQYLKAVRERGMRQPSIVRAEPSLANAPYTYISSPSEIETGNGGVYPTPGLLPGAPRFAQISDITSNSIAFKWLGPVDSGTNMIQGYQINRSIGSGSFSTLTANTMSPGEFYIDTGLTLGVKYNYTIQAINTYGVGPVSSIISAITDNETGYIP